MNKRTQHETLEDVLNSYMASPSGPSKDSLVVWIRKYPQFEQELTEFTASWSVLKWLSNIEQKEEDEETLVLRGMSVVQDILHREGSLEKKKPIISLVEEGKKSGLDIRRLGEVTNLGITIVGSFDRRFIKLSSTPNEAVQAIANAIQRDITDVTQYLKRKPTLSSLALYKADEEPRLSSQQNFFDVVRNDQNLSDEQRTYWLSLEKPGA